MPNTHQLEPGREISLQDILTQGKKLQPDRTAAEAEFLTLRQEFTELQSRLYAEGRYKLLILFQAIDAGGKDGTIRNVLRGVSPQGVRVTSFKKPSAEELAHDFLWRIHRAVPATGMIGMFNRSHYEDVLVVRVDQLVPEDVWQARYEQINQFELFLHDTGTTLLKFYLHISKKEQKKRFKKRLKYPEKQWKFDLGDLGKRKQWDAYEAAFEAMLNRCTTDWAPWHVIPADQKWYRNLAVMRTIVDRLRQLNPQFPPPDEGLDQLEID